LSQSRSRSEAHNGALIVTLLFLQLLQHALRTHPPGSSSAGGVAAESFFFCTDGIVTVSLTLCVRNFTVKTAPFPHSYLGLRNLKKMFDQNTMKIPKEIPLSIKRQMFYYNNV
jgi:hypothetical protein